jgi:hypothetical protein
MQNTEFHPDDCERVHRGRSVAEFGLRRKSPKKTTGKGRRETYTVGLVPLEIVPHFTRERITRSQRCSEA